MTNLQDLDAWKKQGTHHWLEINEQGSTYDAFGSLQVMLLNRTGNVGKDVVGVRSDELNRAHYDDQDNGQHHCVFGDILTLVITP